MAVTRSRPIRRLLLVVTLLLVLPLAVLLLVNLNSGSSGIEEPVVLTYDIQDERFLRTAGALFGPPIVAGNTVTPLQNGVEIFPAMLDAINRAQSSITFETFIYWSGTIGRRFADALAERARAGVKVHVMLDAMGIDDIDDEYLTLMRQAGAEVEVYRPVHWYTLHKLNNRTHRKILVIDGRIGFTGGVGIADVWLGNADAPEHWRESHFRVEGPVVAQMQAAFLDNWMEARQEVLHGELYFPALDTAGPHQGQVLVSSPAAGAETMRLMYLMSIAAARRSIAIATAYFVPDDMVRDALIDARRRGVAVTVIVPGPITDAVVTQSASRSRWGPLLEAGVAIHEFQPTMFHSKVMIVDNAWVSVGSTNFDNRSFRLNDEMNLNVLDTAFALSLAEVFRLDLARSLPMTIEQWRRRPFGERFKDWAAGLLRSQL